MQHQKLVILSKAAKHFSDTSIKAQIMLCHFSLFRLPDILSSELYNFKRWALKGMENLLFKKK